MRPEYEKVLNGQSSHSVCLFFPLPSLLVHCNVDCFCCKKERVQPHIVISESFVHSFRIIFTSIYSLTLLTLAGWLAQASSSQHKESVGLQCTWCP